MHTAAPDQAFTSLRALRHTCFSLDGIGVFGKAEIQRLLVKAEVLLDWAHYYGATRQEVAKKHLERAKGCLDEAWEYAAAVHPVPATAPHREAPSRSTDLQHRLEARTA